MRKRWTWTFHKQERLAANILSWVDAHTDSSPPSKASPYLHQLRAVVQTGKVTEIGIWARISQRGAQKKRKNLKVQLWKLKLAAKKYRLPILKVFQHIGPGWDPGNPDFVRAVQWAKQKPGRILLATSMDRFLRHRDFTTDDYEKNWWPTVNQFEELMEVADGVPLVTYLPPDCSPKKVKKYHSIWGSKVKGNKGGRPRKVKYGPRLDDVLRSKIAWATKMRFPVRDTAFYLERKPTTVQSWIEQMRREGFWGRTNSHNPKH